MSGCRNIQARSYAYDAGARLRFIRPPEGTTAETTGLAVQEREHDYLGREIGRRVGEAAWTTTTWEDGRSTTREPDGGLVHRAYDGRGRLAHVAYEPSVYTAPHDDKSVTYEFTMLDQPKTL